MYINGNFACGYTVCNVIYKGPLFIKIYRIIYTVHFFKLNFTAIRTKNVPFMFVVTISSN